MIWSLRHILGEQLCRDFLNKAVRRVLEKRAGRDLTVIYDVTDGKGRPVTNLDKVALAGRVRVLDDIWDTFESEVIENPTWFDLAIEADNMIAATKDDHHIFLEGIEICSTQPEDGVTHIWLDMGS